jgi:hypothetical protein
MEQSITKHVGLDVHKVRKTRKCVTAAVVCLTTGGPARVWFTLIRISVKLENNELLLPWGRAGWVFHLYCT